MLDAHPVWLRAVESVLAEAEVRVVAQCTRPTLALDALLQHRPDLLVFDHRVSDGLRSGLECLVEARLSLPGLKAIAVSDSADQGQIVAAFAAGVSAYVVKTAHPRDIALAVRQAFDASVFLAHDIRLDSSVRAEIDESVGLTPREREILALVAEGHTNAQIAKRLWVTQQTVKFHLANVYRKLGVANRTEASRWAHLNNIMASPGTTSQPTRP